MNLPIPYPDPMPLPAPVWLLRTLLLLTFFLHVLFMNCLFGGTAVALVCTMRRKSSPFSARLAGDIGRMLPSVFAFTITLGVAPLLFLQVMYGQFLYSSSILIGAAWLAIIGMVVLAYYGVYFFSMNEPGGKTTAVLAVVVLLLASIAFVYSNNFTLMLAPERWPGSLSHSCQRMEFKLARVFPGAALSSFRSRSFGSFRPGADGAGSSPAGSGVSAVDHRSRVPAFRRRNRGQLRCRFLVPGKVVASGAAGLYWWQWIRDRIVSGWNASTRGCDCAFRYCKSRQIFQAADDDWNRLRSADSSRYDHDARCAAKPCPGASLRSQPTADRSAVGHHSAFCNPLHRRSGHFVLHASQGGSRAQDVVNAL